MSQIGWSESAPANSDNLGLGASEIRSLKSAIRTGLDAEHVWPSTGGDAGAHRLGSARAYVGPESAVSSSGTDGRLMVASNTSRLFHVGSNGTMLLGGAGSMQALPGGGALDLLLDDGIGLLPQTHYWAVQAQRATLDATGTKGVSWPSPYSGRPAVFVSTVSGIPTGLSMAYAINVTPTGCEVYGFTSTGSMPNLSTVYLLSIGSRVLG